MKKSLAKITQAAGVASILLGLPLDAQVVTDPEVEGPLPVGLVPVQPVTQPTVGEQPFVRPINFRAGTDLRENEEAGGIVPSEHHWKLLLGFTVGVDYDDNIFLAPNGAGKQGDFLFAIAPTVGIQFGEPSTGVNFLTFTYTPTFVFFLDHTDQNAVEHAVDIKFDHHSDIWKLSGNFNFQALSGGDDPLQAAGGSQSGEQVGERVDRQIYTLGLKYNYMVSDKTSIETGLSGNYTHYDSFLDTTQLVDQNYIDYAITGKTSIGLGLGVGYMRTEGSPNQIYEEALVRVRYYATSKLTFELNGGAEFLQIGSGVGDQVDGIFGISVNYAYSDRTSFVLAGYRNVNPSSTEQNTNYTATGVRVSASQKILGKLIATVAVGYENDEYQTYGLGSVARTDNYFYFQPSLQYPVGHSGKLELFYEYRFNDSTLNEFQFSDNRVGLKFSFAF